MKNLYAQYKMSPPDQKQLAARLMGGKGVTSGVAVAVPFSNAHADFYRKVGMPMNNVLAPNTYSLGVHGGLAGLRGIGSFGTVPVKGAIGAPLVPGVNFWAEIDRQDFISGRQLHQLGVKALKLSWTPVTPAEVTAVESRLNQLKEAGVDVDSLLLEGQRLTKLVYDTGEGKSWETPFLGARGEIGVTDQPEKERLHSMAQLKGWMSAIMAIEPPKDGGYVLPGQPGGFVQGPKTVAGGPAPVAKPGLLDGNLPLIAGGVVAAGLLLVIIAKKRSKA